jgi:hypothetical protein
MTFILKESGLGRHILTSRKQLLLSHPVPVRRASPHVQIQGTRNFLRRSRSAFPAVEIGLPMLPREGRPQ